jgi:hypothetical protein
MKKYLLTRVLKIEYILASAGIAFSGQVINQGIFSIPSFLITFLGVFLFLVLIRIDNDKQDTVRDKIAYPDRAILKRLQFLDLEKLIWRICIAYFICISLFFWTAAFFYGLALIYFWVSRKHIRQPILEHISKEGMIIPIALFGSEMGMGLSIPFALVLLGAFSTYEICRKLDPFGHPAMMSLLQFYGFKKVFWIIVAQLIISAIGAYFLDSNLLLWPVELGVLYVLSRLYKTPREYHYAQTAAAISLFIHIWLA